VNTLRLAILASCLVVATRTIAQTVELKVALFPYLPSASNGSNSQLTARLEREFEARNPDVDLILRPLDPVNDDFYDPLWIAGQLKSGVDLVEVDTVLLGTLLDLEVISPWPSNLPTSDWNMIALEASRHQNQIFGVPHWMCGNFIISRHASIKDARSLDSLTSILTGLNTPQRNLAGNMVGSWDTASLFLDAWADTRSERDTTLALSVPLDPLVLGQVVQFAALGALGSSNPCTDGTYRDDPKLAATDFAKGEADALFGYSERTHYAVMAGAKPEELHITSAPIGNGSDPLWFVDTLVLRNYPPAPSGSTASEQERYNQGIADRKKAALRFTEYLNSPETFSWIHKSEDLSPESPCRYLIPASRTAFGAPAIAQDPVMKQIEPLVTQGTFYPRTQLPGIRRSMTKEIRAAWSPK
jgi:thiamine pyridinylase